MIDQETCTLSLSSAHLFDEVWTSRIESYEASSLDYTSINHPLGYFFLSLIHGGLCLALKIEGSW